MLSFLLLLINIYKFSASEINKSTHVYNELPFALRQTKQRIKSLNVGSKNFSRCRQTKIPFVKGRSIPEFIHIPKNGGGFITFIGKEGCRWAANGTKLNIRWGKEYDWPSEMSFSSQVMKLMMNDDTQHCVQWHRPPHF